MKSKEIFKITKMVSTLVRIFMLVIAALLITVQFLLIVDVQ